MVAGIGIDIVSVQRIGEAIERFGDRFIDRVFTQRERSYCIGKKQPYESYAARFAAKEAAFKALGRGWDECGFASVEVTRDPGARPELVFHGRAKEIAETARITSAFVSLTHDSGVAAAVILLER